MNRTHKSVILSEARPAHSPNPVILGKAKNPLHAYTLKRRRKEFSAHVALILIWIGVLSALASAQTLTSTEIGRAHV